ncbi:MAG TPA: hypothetical protein H9784_07950 [Candidatus Desulfovibrio intestinavium]|uniref:Yip1 domain-containing protein n=1 Tax=Candidatus Desulfovibrio intestinavium TaxID=2838534 RepID=A0A9D2HNM4_9BACT|nr:hypothetical protein [Candidatus Desulfovibrio intestinavium]
MKISCPDCGFFRELSSDRAPSRPVVATCPKCGCRFRFLPEDASSHVLEHGTPEKPIDFRSETVVLPPGAIVPGEPTHAPGQSASPQNDSPQDASRQDRIRPVSASESGAPSDDQAAAPAHAPEPAAPEDAPHRPRNRKGRRHDQPDADANPWDLAPAPAGYISAFYQTTLRIMFGGGRFFARLNPDAPQWRALFYYLVVVLVVICTQLFWIHMSREVLAQTLPPDSVVGLLFRFAINQPLLYGLTGMASLVFQLYILSALLLLGFRLAGVRHAAFYLIFQVVAYSAAPVLLCLIPVLGVQVGIIWSMACIITGCRMALGLDWSRTLLGLALPILFCLLMLMFGLPR